MKAVVIGAGQGCMLILNIIKKMKTNIQIAGIIDDNSKLKGKEKYGIKIIGTSKDIPNLKQQGIEGFVIGIGSSNLDARDQLFKKAKESGLKPINIRHPTAIINETAEIGKGLIIFPGAVVNPFSKINENVTIYTNAVIEHNATIGNNVYISPGVNLAGNVTIKENTFIGIGASIVPGVTIGKNSIIGAGTVVLEDVPDNVVVVGVPGKVIKNMGNSKNE